MPVTDTLLRLAENPDFWAGESCVTSDDEPSELRTTFPVTGGYALVLDIGLKTGERTLGLRIPASSEPVQLACSLPGEPGPAALRWWELDLCGRVIAWGDPTLPHPGLVVALLSPFAPATAEDDEPEIAAMREAAYRSLRRTVPPPAPSGPEQAPLPLFTTDDWWPAPPALSPQVLDEASIAELTRTERAVRDVRSGSRFPREDLADLVRRAAALLRAVPSQQWYAETRPIARHILDSGDLRPVSELLGALTEAGCDHPTVLDALSEPLVTAEACWMVETLAGAEPGTLLRHRL
ncbi:hypothetical protein Aab01nite_56910 [Paractinoplanes abujensis]|uniref:Uncharacterized protein n=1 Tax=Paractinoplanes abujensis TaxID=882441 RepID=A0A7W7CZ10_9ACTN|nr:hypothetical protein [Actinoplanes abujensis]MBB4696110.1 hypothetical protein [Actinoplanes abujensis]GID22101.1 hypothetical protein Aab01nite_56910 [Actinoplanes abujensis]